MAATLPSEILLMVLENLGEEKDYNSLFQSALASKHFTEHALSVLYRLVYYFCLVWSRLCRLYLALESMTPRR